MTQKFISYLFLLFTMGCGNPGSDKRIKIKSDTIKKIQSNTIALTSNMENKPVSILKTKAEIIHVDEDRIQKATVSKSDSMIWLSADMKLDHRIFGYDKPDTSAQKMILISIFTNDVEGNPFKCRFGSYYQTTDMKDLGLKYVKKESGFIKADIIKSDTILETIYFQKKWIRFEK